MSTNLAIYHQWTKPTHDWWSFGSPSKIFVSIWSQGMPWRTRCIRQQPQGGVPRALQTRWLWLWLLQGTSQHIWGRDMQATDYCWWLWNHRTNPWGCIRKTSKIFVSSRTQGMPWTTRCIWQQPQGGVSRALQTRWLWLWLLSGTPKHLWGRDMQASDYFWWLWNHRTNPWGSIRTTTKIFVSSWTQGMPWRARCIWWQPQGSVCGAL